MYWLAVVQQANKGDKEAHEMIRQEDELRAEQGLPSIIEELKAVMNNEKQPKMQMTDFGAMTEEELKYALTHGKVIWRRPEN